MVVVKVTRFLSCSLYLSFDVLAYTTRKVKCACGAKQLSPIVELLLNEINHRDSNYYI